MIAAKDAEIARLRSERDAQVAQVSSLQSCVETLQSAVDQLVALCHAQVDELANYDQRLEDARRTVMAHKKEPRSASPPRELGVRQVTPHIVADLFDERKDCELFGVTEEVCVLPSASDHDRDLGVAEEEEEEGEVWSEEAVAVWDDGRVGEASMERYLVDDRGSARLPILAKLGSDYVDVCNGECVIKENAFVVAEEDLPFQLRVRKGPERGRWRETSFVEFEYCDGTRLPFVPITGVSVRGEGEGEGLLENDEGYGVEYVRVVMGDQVFQKLVDKSAMALEQVWEGMDVQKEGLNVDGGGVEVSVKLMRGGAEVWGVPGTTGSRKVSECLGGGDLFGDATFMLRFVDHFGIAELEFLLHRMQVREVA